MLRIHQSETGGIILTYKEAGGCKFLRALLARRLPDRLFYIILMLFGADGFCSPICCGQTYSLCNLRVVQQTGSWSSGYDVSLTKGIKNGEGRQFESGRAQF